MLKSDRTTNDTDLAKKISKAIINGLAGDFKTLATSSVEVIIDLLSASKKSGDDNLLRAIDIFGAKVATSSIQSFLLSGRLNRDFTPLELENSIKAITQGYKFFDAQDGRWDIQRTIQTFENPLSIPAYSFIRSNFQEILLSLDPQYRDFGEERLHKDLQALDGMALLASEEIWSQSDQFSLNFQRLLFEKSHDGLMLRSTWARQHTWLRHQFYKKPLWTGQKSLSRVYVEPRAEYRIRTDSENEFVRTARDWLSRLVQEWFSKQYQSSRTTQIRLIAGGPGSGKSSFARAICAKLSTLPHARVIFIEAQHLSGSGDLISQIGDYLSKGSNFESNPLTWKPLSNQKLLLVFDGLDEIVRPAQDIGFTTGFVGELNQVLQTINQQEVWACALVLGRPGSINSAAKANGLPSEAIFEFCPLTPLPIAENIDELIRTNTASSEFQPDGKRRTNAIAYAQELKATKAVSQIDMRDNFWNTLSIEFDIADHYKLTDDNPLLQSRYGELTSEPILIFLLFLSGEFDEVHTDLETPNTRELYEKILSKIRSRPWGVVEHPATRGLDDDGYYFLLECLGISAWISGGRIGDVQNFEIVRSLLLPPNLDQSLLTRPAAQLENIATSFFTKANDGYEFVHKSFSDFLTARGFVRFFTGTVVENFQKNGPLLALNKLLQIFSRTAITGDILQFISDTISEFPKEKTTELLDCYESILIFSITSGAGLDAFGDDRSLREAQKISATCDLSLKAVHHALRTHLKSTYCETRSFKIPWEKSPIDTTSWIQSLRNVSDDEFVFSIMSGLNIPRMSISNVNCQQANFNGSDLSGSNIHFCNFDTSDFRYCDLRNADLKGSNFSGSNFEWANFLDADLKYCVMPSDWKQLAGTIRD